MGTIDGDCVMANENEKIQEEIEEEIALNMWKRTLNSLIWDQETEFEMSLLSSDKEMREELKRRVSKELSFGEPLTSSLHSWELGWIEEKIEELGF